MLDENTKPILVEIILKEKDDEPFDQSELYKELSKNLKVFQRDSNHIWAIHAKDGKSDVWSFENNKDDVTITIGDIIKYKRDSYIIGGMQHIGNKYLVYLMGKNGIMFHTLLNKIKKEGSATLKDAKLAMQMFGKFEKKFENHHEKKLVEKKKSQKMKKKDKKLTEKQERRSKRRSEKDSSRDSESDESTTNESSTSASDESKEESNKSKRKQNKKRPNFEDQHLPYKKHEHHHSPLPIKQECNFSPLPIKQEYPFTERNQQRNQFPQRNHFQQSTERKQLFNQPKRNQEFIPNSNYNCNYNPDQRNYSIPPPIPFNNPYQQRYNSPLPYPYPHYPCYIPNDPFSPPSNQQNHFNNRSPDPKSDPSNPSKRNEEFIPDSNYNCNYNSDQRNYSMPPPIPFNNYPYQQRYNSPLPYPYLHCPYYVPNDLFPPPSKQNHYNRSQDQNLNKN